MSAEHIPVMAAAVVDALVPVDGCTLVDCTYGRGGHAAELLVHIGPEGRYLAIDRDPVAVRHATELSRRDSRVVPVRGRAGDVEAIVADLGWAGLVDGVLADLGVSSPQLDLAERGFSFNADGPLDMRMDPDQGESAADWVREAREAEMIQVFREYGEERFARRIARAIIAARRAKPIVSTVQLAEIVARAHPAWERHRHPATRVFQAIRIRVNDELAQARECFAGAARVLKPGGRLAFIAFHSLEDRIVKRGIRDAARPPDPFAPAEVRARPIPRLRSVGKAQRADDDEIAANPRARSAVLRVAERLEVAA